MTTIRPSLPGLNDITSSPCRRRPDTGKPCVLLDYPKDNTSCENCGILGKGNCWDPVTFEIPHEPTKPPKPKQRSLSKCATPECIKKTRSKSGYCKGCLAGRPTPDLGGDECIFPGCESITRSASGYCSYCRNIVWSRRRSWRIRSGDRPVDEAWLHRPVNHDKNNYSK